MARGSGSWQLATADDARASRCAVYTNADIEHARRVFGFEAQDVVAVGNPDLSRFGFLPSMLGGALRDAVISQSQTIMYIDTGLAATGLVFDSRQQFIRHIVSTARALAAHGKSMCLKPHPAHDPAFLRTSLAGTGVDLVSNEDFVARLRLCAACIVEPTTLALVPALMGMPMLYANYDALEQLRYGPVLTSYPRGYLLPEIGSLPAILRDDFAKDRAVAAMEWIERNSGPLPAEEMPDRVADMVTALFARTTHRGSGARAHVATSVPTGN
jgi:hypothetical protein